MEQPPGSIDDLQPQDLSTSSIPTVIDLTRRGGECVLNSAALDAVRVVKSPGWYPNSGTSNHGLQFSESGTSDITLQSGDQIQPDNAFSHTTVTLSYVSRSHVFSTQDSLSQHLPLYSVPPISSFSIHPPCDIDKGVGETGNALNQHYLESVDGPVDLVAQLSSQALLGPENDVGGSLAQEPHEVNGEVISSDGDLEKSLQGEEEHSLTQQNSRVLENGQGDSWSSSGASPQTLTSVTGEDEGRGGSDVVFIMSKKQDPVVVVSDSTSVRDLSSLSREYISPLDDPVSPSATSLDDVEDVFILPQASSSPSGDNCYLAEEAACDDLSTEETIEPNSGISDGITRLDSSNENKQRTHRRKTVLEPLIDLTDDVCVSDDSENKPKTVVPHMNGNAKVIQRTLKERKLPLRSGRGTRLEAIVMNINSSRYNVSGCIRTHKKASAFQSAARESTLASPRRTNAVLLNKRRGKVKAPFSVKQTKRKAVAPVTRGKSRNVNTDTCKDSTSDSEIINNSKAHSSVPPKSPPCAVHRRSKREPGNVSPPVQPLQSSPLKSKRKTSSQSSPPLAVHKNSKKEPEVLSLPDPSVEIHVERFSLPPSKSPKKSPGKAKSKVPGSKTSPTAKTKGARTPKRRRKKPKQGQSSLMFSPKEPEIKLKYINYKEEKRDLRLDSFSPFIRVERQQSSPSLCTVINYPEEVNTTHKKGQQQQQAHTSGFISAVVPSTSCLQLGRVSMLSQHQRSLVCSLCGQSANAMDLGDLHGPYYPEGYQPSTKTPASTSGLKEEDDYSDSDSSSCSRRGRGRKRAIRPQSWALRPGTQLKQKGLLENQRWAGNSTGSPAAKRARSDAAGSADVEDWYSPPVLPLEPCEYWLHEDCGIWSAGVFLVKGKVYGLEEAVKVAQETICSACHSPGATLGCFFKGCPNKCHYRCALESADCVLIEENFSMKCKKHKNKTFKAPPGNRREDR
ncbi:transcription factor 20 isoform X1 [Acanthochromis polyacanthus]|uniref:transcription factor 20 isoform X1 n=1 Tax=Acanthochromis polyacanthus TaxID=80966 RepID=UPI0022340D55|nr:transcription factor 20 isoform X1 [Acanthochromis polyacanthus]